MQTNCLARKQSELIFPHGASLHRVDGRAHAHKASTPAATPHSVNGDSIKDPRAPDHRAELMPTAHTAPQHSHIHTSAVVDAIGALAKDISKNLDQMDNTLAEHGIQVQANNATLQKLSATARTTHQVVSNIQDELAEIRVLLATLARGSR